MKKIIFSFIFIFGLLIFPQIDVIACSCSLPIPKRTLNEQVKIERKSSDAIFIGEVLEVKDNKFSFIVKIKVESNWKGDKDAEVTIFTGKGGGDCGYPFQVGESYLIYASKLDNGNLTTNICRRTKLLSESQDDIKILNKKK